MKKLSLPPDRETLRSLEAGDEVLLSGPALTMRDAALARLSSLAESGEKPPFEVTGQLIFHAGPAPPSAGRPAGAIGPTTSSRMDRYLETLFELGVPATLGKGPRSRETLELHERHGAVYFTTIGGIGALLAGHVTGLEVVAWEELGPEAVFRAVLDELPALVAIDSRGRDHLAKQYRKYRSTGSARD
ncbi:MAG: FumA C-terminus/TtdB family hydratase beta subunit [Actinomycetota bacterium]